MFHPRNCPHDSAPAQPQRERKTPTRSHTRGGPLGQFSLAFLAPATNNECPVAATFGNAKNHKCNSISCQSVCAQCSDTTSSVQPIQNAMDKMQHEMENRQLKTHEMQTRNGARAGQNATRNGARARQNATRNGEPTMTKTHEKGRRIGAIQSIRYIHTVAASIRSNPAKETKTDRAFINKITRTTT